jgi:hypothetical protein
VSLRIRRGGSAAAQPPPGGGAAYGPTDGAAVVRASTGPRTVSNPGGGISFNSSTSLQSAINANPISSTFVCSVNNPVWNGTVSPGTKRPTIIFPGTVGQKIIDGGGGNFIAINGGDGVVVKGGTWQNFASQFAAMVTGDDWTVQDTIVTGIGSSSGGVGISVQGLNNLVSHNIFHSNANQGMATGPSALGQCDGLVVEYNEMYNNNTALLNPGNQGGAHKFVLTRNGWYHHNWCHDNMGFGPWWDTDNADWLIEESVMENNWRSGLFYEANDGSVIRRNYVYNNGRTNIIGTQNATFENCVQVRLSDNNATSGNGNPVQVTRNLVDYDLAQSGTLGGLILMWDHTATTARCVQNNDVFENDFWLRGTQTMRVGGEDTAPAAFPVWSLDNNYFNNQYHVASTAVSYWKWDTGTGAGVAQTWAAWQGFHPTGETRLLI